VSSAAITLCVASQRVFTDAVVYFVIAFSPETFGYTLVREVRSNPVSIFHRCRFITHNNVRLQFSQNVFALTAV